jgi:hypothetical protein
MDINPEQPAAIPPLQLTIQLHRDDTMSAFGAFLRCDCAGPNTPVVLLNVYACMAPVLQDSEGNPVELTREDRLRTVIGSLMHEFGHALEKHFDLPVNEEALEKVCAEWEGRFETFTPTIEFQGHLVDGEQPMDPVPVHARHATELEESLIKAIGEARSKAMELGRKIETLGCSYELTQASVMCSDLVQILNNALPH